MSFDTLYKKLLKTKKKIKIFFNNLISFKMKFIYIIPASLFVILLSFLSMSIYFEFLSKKKIEAGVQTEKAKLVLKEKELKDYKESLKTVLEIRERYKKAIKEIVDMIYHKDIAMGGGLETIPDTDEIRLLHLRNIVQSMDDDISLLEEAKNYLLARKEFADNFPFIWPVQLDGQPDINSSFGIRSNRETNTKPLDGYHFHPGIDIAGDKGDPIIATAGGQVIYVKENDPIYGKLIIIQHKYEFSTYYGHLDKIHVKLGQTVVRGDVIGEMGSSGKTTGVHLHYEIRTSGTPIDPLTFLSMTY